MKKLTLLLYFTLSLLVVKAQEPFHIGSVEAIPMGNSTTVFRDYDTQKHLEGEQRLIFDSRKYVEAYFTNGLANGAWNSFQNNILVEKLNYVDGLLDGVQTYYFLDGTTVKRVSNMTNGKLNGKYTEYHSNGKISKKIYFKDGKEDGKSQTYDEDGTLTSDCFYVNGVTHGKQTNFYSSSRGDFTRISSYKMGVPTGKFVETFTNGVVRKSGEYDANGKLTGQWVERKKDGKITSDQTYKDGILDGATKTYYNDGTVERITMYANGDKHGLTTEYYFGTNGQIKSEINFVKGVQQGAYKRYYDSGQIKEEGRVEEGSVVFSKEYYSNGNVKQVRERVSGVWKTIEKN